MMVTVPTVCTVTLALHILALLACASPATADSVAPATPGRTDRVRHKRAPGWGKRDGEEEAFDGETEGMEEGMDDSPLDKRAPGWGKRDFDLDKRAPGWGKRAPGWGKRAPGWGKRAPGWGKRAPGWGKRSMYMSEPMDFDKRAPGWGKRAPGWGKRAPGWGKRSGDLHPDMCDVMKEEADLFVSKAMEAELRYQTQCGNEADARLAARK